jgi:hypothetical protein
MVANQRMIPVCPVNGRYFADCEKNWLFLGFYLRQALFSDTNWDMNVY